MIDKSKRKASAQRCGDMVVIRMTGGPDCLWLNMYLDTEQWQMTCDSDIGFYAYHWGKGANKTESFVEFCVRWFGSKEWLLRKCIGERHGEKQFDREHTATNLCSAFIDYHGDDVDTADIMDVLEEARGYGNEREAWLAAVNILADERDVCLPDEWYECIVEDYTPWQKRFAEICRDVIAPELMQFVHMED